MTTSGFMSRLNQRWTQRQEAFSDCREPFTAQATLQVAASPQAVWDFLNAPGVGVLFDHRHVRSFPVPGTPPEGVGHQYCAVSRHEGGHLAVTMSEIVEYDPPRHVVRRIVNSPVPILESHTIGEIPGGSTYTVRLGLHIPAGTARRFGRDARSELDEFAAKVKALAESGVVLASPAGGLDCPPAGSQPGANE